MTQTTASVRFIFVCDTKQGPLLTYRRSDTILDVGENIEIVGSYCHFTVKDANFNKTGDETQANSCFGTGFLELDFGAGKPVNIHTFDWMTYYTNGGFKECVFHIQPVRFASIETYLPAV